MTDLNTRGANVMPRKTALAILLLLLPATALGQGPQTDATDMAVAECDRLAASPYDTDAASPGVEAYDIDHARAVPACEVAVARQPQSTRFVFQLGRAYGAAKREADAVRLYRQAAGNGHAAAMNSLGFRYIEGRGVPVDEVEAVRWFRLAADGGSAFAMTTLGDIYGAGSRALPADEEEAARWYRKAAERGYAPAMAKLGSSYLDGAGVLQDHVEAARWFRLAAEKGDAAGMFSLGMSHDNGEGVPKDPQEAARLILSALQRGDSQLTYALKQIGNFLPLSPEGCQALRRRVKDAGGVIGGQADDDLCGPEVIQAVEALRQATAPR